MTGHLLRFAFRHRWGVLLVVVLVCGLGLFSLVGQRVDAYPDISSQMVGVITVYPGRAAEEVERQVTIPIENAMRGVPRVEVVRSRSIFGLSLVQLIFEEGSDSYWVRQRVQERLGGVSLPDGAEPELGPLATAYGEVFRYELVSEGAEDLMELRTLNDWVVIPRLMRAPGVAEVSNFGGFAKQHAVTLDPAQLRRYRLSVDDVVEALSSNNASAGGGVLARGSMSYVVRGTGSLSDQRELGSIFLRSVGGVPVYLRDVATVGLDSQVPSGIFSKDRTDAGVSGIVLLRKGENPSDALLRVNEAVDELNASGLPAGVRIRPYYDRTHLVEATLSTVSHSVLVGITLVVLLLVFFLGRPVMAGLVALTIPFSLLFALILLRLTDIPLGLLSVGAIDFGIIVDGAIIMAENIARRLGALGPEASRAQVAEATLEAALDVERPIVLSLGLIVAAYLPLLTLTRIEGLLFRPMALTLTFTVLGALVFSLFVVPVLATFVFRRGYHEWENPLLQWVKPRYAHVVEVLLARRWAVAGGVVAALVLVCALVLPRLGTEFLPHMDEGVIWVRANFPEGTSLQQTSAFGRVLREAALEFPEVRFASIQAGRNDSGTDPFPPSRIEMMMGLMQPLGSGGLRARPELVAALSSRFREEFPTTRFNFTQPIIDSVTEDANGTSANLAVELTGADSEVLLALAHKTVDALKKVPGATDVNIEQEGPQPQLVIRPDRAWCARLGVRVGDVTRLINTALGGEPVGTLYEGERQFDIVVRFAPEHRRSPEAVGQLPVFDTEGRPVPLSRVAHIEMVEGQTLIAREGGRRRITVRSDIVGRDQGGFVEEAQVRFAQEVTVPEGYRVAWLGMFENLARARRHFALLVPTTLALIAALLYAAFGSLRATVLLLLPIPFSLVGGVVALWVRGMNLNVATGVGFATVFAVAIMDGILMVRGITVHRQRGASLDEAIIQGRLTRLRPILMTSSVAILGLLPASLATGLGSDVQRPLATVIIWGLFSSTLLTLFVVPVFYRLLVPPLPERYPAEALQPVHALSEVS